jgi:hypothetical protein
MFSGNYDPWGEAGKIIIGLITLLLLIIVILILYIFLK